MSLLVNTEDVEQVARGWLERKYGKKLGKLKFIEVMSTDGVWDVKVETKLATGVLSVSPHVVHLRIDAHSTEILGYSQSEVKKEKG